MQCETARHGPMIRCIRPADRGLRGGYALCKNVVKGGIRKPVIRVYDVAGNVIETHEHKGDFREW